jgi:hypothetical protein
VWEVQGEDEKADDDEKEKDWTAEEKALMDLSELEQQRVVAIKTSMCDARPQEGGGE